MPVPHARGVPQHLERREAHAREVLWRMRRRAGGNECVHVGEYPHAADEQRHGEDGGASEPHRPGRDEEERDAAQDAAFRLDVRDVSKRPVARRVERDELDDLSPGEDAAEGVPRLVADDAGRDDVVVRHPDAGRRHAADTLAYEPQHDGEREYESGHREQLRARVRPGVRDVV